MLELCTLASGSSGNSLLVTDGRTHVLVDAGISCRRICTGLKELGVEPTELAGVLITHEHSDHISGLTTLTKQLTAAYRSLSRPSSAPDAKAFPLRSF